VTKDGKYLVYIMKKRNVIPLTLLCILAIAVLAAPVVGLLVEPGDMITATDGTTIAMITLDGLTAIEPGGTITIDITELHQYVADSFTFTTDNVAIDTEATVDGWTVEVADSTLTLNSTTGADPGETINLTFTGAIYPWVDTLGIEKTVVLTATRSDETEGVPFNFVIQTGTLLGTGLSITDGETITSPYGTTSRLIAITESDIAPGGTVIIDLYYAKGLFASFTFSDANIAVSTDPAGIWTTAPIEYDYLTLTATGGTPKVGDTINVTFTGTSGNPFIAYSGGPMTNPLTAIRSDRIDPEPFSITIDTAPPVSTGMSIENGAPITSTTGATSPVITITDQPIAQDGTITIFVPFLPSLIAINSFNNDNVMVSNTGEAIWTREVVTGDRVILTSTGNDTAVGDKVTVTFTGASNPWITSLPGLDYSYTTAVRGDEQGTGYFNITISTPSPTDLSIIEGATITSMSGFTTPVIMITGADILPEGTITMEVTALNQYVANGTLTNDNIRIVDNATQATWTASVASDALGFNYLTLTSTDGPTIAGETVNVTFTGETNPWKGDTNGEKTVTLLPTRGDGAGAGSFNFVINTTLSLDVDFSATPRWGIAPLSVAFTDKSNMGPIEWSWDFGDGGNSTDPNPVYIYTQPGLYDVSMTVWNKTSMGMVSKTNYINVLNGAVIGTDTEFSGLTVTNCGGPQTIMVNTSILTATLSSGNSVLEIQAPAESGFKSITFSAQNGGFTQNGNIITGNPTGVHMESGEIAPASGFSDSIGKKSSFRYTIDLPAYPCKAKLTTEIWEGPVTEYDTLFRQVASQNLAYPVGTAYTVKITKTNFPSDAQIKIIMSVDSGWSPSISGENVMIWHIADDKSYGEILPTRYLYTDPLTNLDYYEADSPRGFSTFGVSSLTGSNNPFQIIAFVATNVVNQAANAQISSGTGSGSSTGTSVSANIEQGGPSSDMQAGGIVVPTPVPPNKPAPLTQPAMSTNVGMLGWLLAIVQNNPIILIGVAGVIVVVGYFGWWKQRL
jgi:PKD repeat protein